MPKFTLSGVSKREHGDAGDNQRPSVEGLHHARTAHTRRSPAMHMQPAMEVEEMPDAVYAPGSPCSPHLAAATRAWRRSGASGPELSTRQLRACGHGPHFCPADVRVDAVAVAAIGAGNDVFAPHDAGVGQDAIRYQFGGLDGRRLVGDDPRDVDLPF